MPLPKLHKTIDLPQVVLIGRTNAGKSSLFNRLCDAGHAIVSPVPNTTRDQNRGMVHWKGLSFELVDTGGLDLSVYDPLDKDIQIQVKRAIKDAKLILFVVDGQGEIMPQDMESAKLLQRQSIPVVVCVNKADSSRMRQDSAATFARLPFKEQILCSAKNGTGTGDLLDAIFARIPAVVTPEILTSTIKVALVGQPNVGKSSLFNGLLGEDRVIVSDLPHTTRDPHDTVLEYKDQLFTIIDTAGLRRQGRVGHGTERVIEQLSVKAAKQMVDECDIAVMMIEAQRKIHKQDKSLIDYLKYSGKSFIIAVNKWDLIPDKSPSTINDFMKYFNYHFDFAPHVPFIFISALERQRVAAVLDLVLEVYNYRNHFMDPAELDAALRQVLGRQPRQRRKVQSINPKKALFLKSLEQTSANPPQFKLLTPKPMTVAPAVINLLEKAIRERCPYKGVRINIDVTSA